MLRSLKNKKHSSEREDFIKVKILHRSFGKLCQNWRQKWQHCNNIDYKYYFLCMKCIFVFISVSQIMSSGVNRMKNNNSFFSGFGGNDELRDGETSSVTLCSFRQFKIHNRLIWSSCEQVGGSDTHVGDALRSERLRSIDLKLKILINIEFHIFYISIYIYIWYICSGYSCTRFVHLVTC